LILAHTAKPKSKKSPAKQGFFLIWVWIVPFFFMMVAMPRFQSRLFNWIDQSLPAQIGRSVRRSLDQKLRQLAGLPIQELPRLLAYQVAKTALYPVYLITSTVKRTFPALDRSKVGSKEALRSQPEAVGLLSESKAIPENNVELKVDFPKTEIPLLLRPLAKFLDWIDRTKIRLDRNITAIVKRQSDNLTTSETTEAETKLIANRIFAEIWRQKIEQSQAEQNSLKESNGLAENVALGKNTRLEQLRRLIEAAIAYFFGGQSTSQNQSLADNEEVAEIFGTESSDVEALADSPKLRRKQVNSANSDDRLLADRKKRLANKNAIQQADTRLAESTNNLDRLRDLIAAAIDYFIGKRSLDGDRSANVDDVAGMSPDLLSQQVMDKLQPQSGSLPNQNSESEFSDALKIDNQIERLQKLIEDAIAYFFGKQRSQPTLDETSDITPNQATWLTMEDIFGDDNGPWPLPLEYESIAFSKSPDRIAIHSSGELQNFETTTTQISEDRLEGSLVFEENFLEIQQKISDPEGTNRPLRAWIEAQATILGYAYNPVMTVVFWIDMIVLKVENLIINFWKRLIILPKRLVNFIRYGNK
jgi:hypothetical protein